MKKKGFTLVELLAVIAILAILVILSLPNVMSMYHNAKKKSFLNEVEIIYNTASEAYMKDNIRGDKSYIYAKSELGLKCIKELNLTGRKIYYYVEINNSGSIKKLYVKDNTYQFKIEKDKIEHNDIKLEDIEEYGNDAEEIYISCDEIDTVKSYLVTYDSNGGSNSPGNQIKKHNVDLELSTVIPTRENYTFMGWNTNSDGSGINYSSGDTYIRNDNVILYAKWIINTYVVTYYPNGGSGTMEPSIATYNEDFVTRQNSFTKTGYSFNGWNTKSDGTGTAWPLNGSGIYENGNGTHPWKWTYTKDITLYARWEQLSVTCKKPYDGCSQLASWECPGSTCYPDRVWLDKNTVAAFGSGTWICEHSCYRTGHSDYYWISSNGIYRHLDWPDGCYGSGWVKKNGRCEKTFTGRTTCPEGSPV